jgi:hypothetical protein
MNTVRNRYLVMGLNGLVLRDLLETMSEGFPALQPVTVPTVDDAVKEVSKASGWRFAFLNLGPDAFIASELAMLFKNLDTRIVLLGNAAEDAACTSTYPVLMRPFSSEDILALLGKETCH